MRSGPNTTPRLAAQASLFPYGPVRKSAIALVGQHPALKFDMKPHLPTEAGNFAGALRLDGGFWSEHEARLKERFSAWLKGG